MGRVGRWLGLLVFLFLVAGVTGAAAKENGGKQGGSETNGIPNPLGGAGQSSWWTLTLNGVEKRTDGDLDRVQHVYKQYVFQVRVDDGGGFIYNRDGDSNHPTNMVLHSWPIYAATADGKDFAWYGFMDGGFDARKPLNGFISGTIESPALPARFVPTVAFSGTLKKQRGDQIYEIKGKAITLHMQADWPWYWTGEYNFHMERRR